MGNSHGSQGASEPVLSPDLSKELAIYEQDMEILAEVKAKLKALAKSIKNHGNVMNEVIQVFSLYQDDQAAQIRSLSAVDQIDSTLRSKFSQAQSDWNAMASSGTSATDGKKAAADMVKQIQEIEAFIKYEQGLGDKSVIDQPSLKNMQSAIDSIKESFGTDGIVGKNGKFTPNWGHPAAMEAVVAEWLKDMKKSGLNIPGMKSIQDGFQTCNQSVSELSSTTNSRLQFVENQYKQGLGEENAAIQAYQKMNANTVRHFTSN